MQITVSSVTPEDKGKWRVLHVTYKNGSQMGRKDVVSFGESKNAYLSLASATPGDMYEVKSEQDAKGFWKWVSAEKVGHESVSEPAASKTPSKGGWETPEERALRQSYIIRQSSLSTAVEFLNHNKKNYDVNEVFTLAKSFEEFVFGRKASNSQPNVVSEIEEMDDAI